MQSFLTKICVVGDRIEQVGNENCNAVCIQAVSDVRQNICQKKSQVLEEVLQNNIISTVLNINWKLIKSLNSKCWVQKGMMDSLHFLHKYHEDK